MEELLCCRGGVTEYRTPCIPPWLLCQRGGAAHMPILLRQLAAASQLAWGRSDGSGSGSAAGKTLLSFTSENPAGELGQKSNSSSWVGREPDYMVNDLAAQAM